MGACSFEWSCPDLSGRPFCARLAFRLDVARIEEHCIRHSWVHVRVPLSRPRRGFRWKDATPALVEAAAGSALTLVLPNLLVLHGEMKSFLCYTGRVDPVVDLEPLKVYHWPGRGYYSRDHRRLKCLKEYQEQVHNRDIFVRRRPAVPLDIRQPSWG